MSSALFFTTSNLYIQDGAIPEYKVGDKTSFALEAYAENGFEESVEENIRYLHIEDATYDIVGLVYKKCYDQYAFMDLGAFTVFIEDPQNILEVGKYYQGIVSLDYDIWNDYHLELRDSFFREDIEQKGIIKSITVDTSLYIPLDGNPRIRTKKGVEPKFTESIQKTDCWLDEEVYTNGSVTYLIEVEFDPKSIKTVLGNIQIDHQTIINPEKTLEEEFLHLTPVDFDDPSLLADENYQELLSMIQEKIDMQHEKAKKGDVAALFNLGELAYNSKNYEEAFTYWKKAIVIDYHASIKVLRERGLDSYAKGFLKVLASIKTLGLTEDTAIPACNDFDKDVAIKYYLNERFGEDQWKSLSQKKRQNILEFTIQVHNVHKKFFFDIAPFFDIHWGGCNNWDFHTF
ncbi:hypothetical protein SUSP_002877 (plasmid) [Sulfurospirillum sp. 'SP']|nr:tetratricopeptide repeat protein [Sulfurospirillum sp. 'SP']WNZ00460.1 hypothetical protein SUSP_002877 [Sulfurospirillum sp. 'SP']